MRKQENKCVNEMPINSSFFLDNIFCYCIILGQLFKRMLQKFNIVTKILLLL